MLASLFTHNDDDDDDSADNSGVHTYMCVCLDIALQLSASCSDNNGTHH